MIHPDDTLDPSVQLQVLASLIEFADQWIHEDIDAARRAGATWADIGRLLGVPAATVRAYHAQVPAGPLATGTVAATPPTRRLPLATN